MPDLSRLTACQREIYLYIRNTIRLRRVPPTIREIGAAFDIKSPNGAVCHLTALKKKGFISQDANKARSIVILGERSPEERLAEIAAIIEAKWAAFAHGGSIIGEIYKLAKGS